MSSQSKDQAKATEMNAALEALLQSCAEMKNQLPDLEKSWQFVLTQMHLQVIDQVQRAMDSEKITRAELARRVGCSRAHITQLLNETVNFKLETIAKLAVALDRDIAVRLLRKDENIAVRRIKDEHDVITMLKSLPDVIPRCGSSISEYRVDEDSLSTIKSLVAFETDIENEIKAA